MEKRLYRIVENHFKDQHVLVTKTNTGIKGGQVDVVIVKAVFSDLLNDCEVISIEVKSSTENFLKSLGQTLGYSIFSDRCYLAARGDFTNNEISIADKLGVGLIRIKGRKCETVASSKLFKPLEYMKLKLLNKLNIHRCVICRSYFILDDYSEKIQNAIKQKRNFVYWLFEQDSLAYEKGLEDRKLTYKRRYVCKDCIEGFVSKLMSSTQ